MFSSAGHFTSIIMQKLTIFILALVYPLIVYGDHHQNPSEKNQILGQKAAQKPYNYVIVDYMDIADGQEQNYLKAEAIWHKVHETWAQEGKILGWGLAKARKNKLNIEYITWKLVHSREDVVGLYDMDNIEKIVGETDFQVISDLTSKSRNIRGSEVLRLSDYTLPEKGLNFGELNPKTLAFHWNFMTPSKGKTAEFIEVEHRYAQPWAQAKTNLNPSFLGWDLQQVVSKRGNTHSSGIRTVDLFRKDQNLSDEQKKVINKKVRDLGIWPKDLNVGAMRKMDRVTFDVVYMTDRSDNGVARLWKKLAGSWTAPGPKGDGYRTKTITPFNEKLQWFNLKGELKGSSNKPISVEFVSQMPTFSVYKNDGNKAFSIPFEVDDKAWHEYAGFANANWSTFHYTKTNKLTNELSVDEELDAFLKTWTEAFNNKDVEALVNLYDVDADVIYQNDIQNKGKEAMRQHFTLYFAKNSQVIDTYSEVERKYLSSSHVIESGVWRKTGNSDLLEPQNGRYSVNLHKKNGDWLILHDRGWALKDDDSSGSKIKSRDNLSKNAEIYLHASIKGDTNQIDQLLHSDIEVYVNDLKISGKEKYMERLAAIQQSLSNPKLSDTHVHTNYFAGNGLAMDGIPWKEVRETPTIWSNCWSTIEATGKKTGASLKFRIHADLRWENNKVVEMLFYYDPKQLNNELGN